MSGVLALSTAVLLSISSCATAPPSEAGAITVFAAASLQEAFESLDGGARFNFGGSDLLAEQIRQGAHADVFASASPALAQELFEQGLLYRPRVFATNQLVVIVPRPNPARIRAVEDLDRSGVQVVIAAPGVPAGDYARRSLRRLGAASVLDNVVSEEQDVKEVAGKVALGEAHAGFVYVTDVGPVEEHVASIAVPARVQPAIRYVIAVVRTSALPGPARQFAGLVLGKRGRQALAAAGFGLP